MQPLFNILLSFHAPGFVLVELIRKSMEKPEVRPLLATPKPLNRSPQQVPHVIVFRVPIHKQNLVTIPQGDPFPRMRENAHQKCLLGFFLSRFFQRPTAKSPKPIFAPNTRKSNDAVPRKDVPLRVGKQQFNI